MALLKELSTIELKNGISRCQARLSGIMPMGVMKESTVLAALKQYVEELNLRSDR